MYVNFYNVLSNTFLVALSDEVPENLSEVAHGGCSKALVDGFILGELHNIGHVDATMHIYNSDGSRAKMSGNGLMCLARALRDTELKSSKCRHRNICIQTDSGLRNVQTFFTDGFDQRMWTQAHMGDFTPGEETEEAGYRKAYINVGNDHLVVEVPDAKNMTYAKAQSMGEELGESSNVEFISSHGAPNDIFMRVWEQGVGVTASCGTGACAAAYWGRKWFFPDNTSSLIKVRTAHGYVIVDTIEKTLRADIAGPRQEEAIRIKSLQNLVVSRTNILEEMAV